ncbi:MAG: hypothetical protein U9532_03995 ['Conium maculatum' witches'-broom phytoplasma]|nr:hypothetical protein ['Conium maculatum' witches'-broom phytoplasma]
MDKIEKLNNNMYNKIYKNLYLFKTNSQEICVFFEKMFSMIELQWIYDEHGFDRQEKNLSKCEYCGNKMSHKDSSQKKELSPFYHNKNLLIKNLLHKKTKGQLEDFTLYTLKREDIERLKTTQLKYILENVLSTKLKKNNKTSKPRQ